MEMPDPKDSFIRRLPPAKGFNIFQLRYRDTGFTDIRGSVEIREIRVRHPILPDPDILKTNGWRTAADSGKISP
jgi:hypothetical protein